MWDTSSPPERKLFPWQRVSETNTVTCPCTWRKYNLWPGYTTCEICLSGWLCAHTCTNTECSNQPNSTNDDNWVDLPALSSWDTIQIFTQLSCPQEASRNSKLDPSAEQHNASVSTRQHEENNHLQARQPTEIWHIHSFFYVTDELHCLCHFDLLYFFM